MSLLGGIGAGLAQFAGTYQQQQHTAAQEKARQQQIQLQGLQALLGQNDLPMDAYMHAIGAMADLTKDPTTKQVYEHLKQTVDQQQFPVGPEKQTLDSMMQRLLGKTSQAADQGQGLEPTPLPNVQTAPSMVRAGELPRNVYNQQLALPARIAERQASMKPTSMVLPDGRTAMVGPDGSVVGVVNAKLPSVFNAETKIKATEDLAKKRWENTLTRIGLVANNAAAKPVRSAAFTALYAQGLNPLDPNLPQEQMDAALKTAAAGVQQREVLKAQQAKTLDDLRKRTLSEPSSTQMQTFRAIQTQKDQFDTLQRKVLSDGRVGRSKLALAHQLQELAGRMSEDDPKKVTVLADIAKASAEGEEFIGQEQQGKAQLGQMAAEIDRAYPGYAEVDYGDDGWPTLKMQALPKTEGIAPPPGGAPSRKTRGQKSYNVDLKKYGLEP